MKVKEIEQLFHKELDAIYGKDEVHQFFYMCIESFYNLSRLDLALDTNLSITTEEQPQIMEALNHLKAEKPIQYLLGETEFYGLTFKVTEDTLIPRPETEELVELILNTANSEFSNLDKLNFLDIGTGTGCVAISLAKHIAKAKVNAIDVSEEALKIAKLNAIKNEVEVNFIQQNILDHVEALSHINKLGKLDVIVSNPPYVRELEKQEIKPNVLENEPHLALFVSDEDPLVFYKTITEIAEKQLKPNGFLFFEINQYLGKEMKALVESYAFKNVEIIKDGFGNDRMLKAQKIDKT
ncbi:peptide chain release factor N(5)-glutamine methyltransferase [Aurantibacter aestuarii]|uniref:peptide chain release factor N(5)-glutamine methyltransferase n=1 Tax=Aurantibacter aestuarii TaxID=1266046 RepID=A0A2T1N9A6_9FLAO|nr:peptide chain release factor N(5)-glutamine methyltransferase [Aurantibacter aestuarii]PSG88454.1 peptide chain release factor N(5)-glutamine methyltransferase [Aurantibacter aestuarii]